MRLIVCSIAVACSSPAAPMKPVAAHAPDASSEVLPCNGSNDPIGVSEIVAYCSHVADSCCIGNGQWGCNNVAYIEWYDAHCHR
jgi:hypothetical protein